MRHSILFRVGELLMIASSSHQHKRRLALPLVIFLVVGMAVTIASAVSYWALAELGGFDPNLSLLFVFAVFMLVGFFAHGRLSFGGYLRTGNVVTRLGRYAAVSVMGLLVNELFIYVLVKLAGGPVWWPVVPMILVTPWLVFAFNRFWVFPEVSHEC